MAPLAARAPRITSAALAPVGMPRQVGAFALDFTDPGVARPPPAAVIRAIGLVEMCGLSRALSDCVCLRLGGCVDRSYAWASIV